jgi:hypothetical protein
MNKKRRRSINAIPTRSTNKSQRRENNIEKRKYTWFRKKGERIQYIADQQDNIHEVDNIPSQGLLFNINDQLCFEILLLNITGITISLALCKNH